MREVKLEVNERLLIVQVTVRMGGFGINGMGTWEDRGNSPQSFENQEHRMLLHNDNDNDSIFKLKLLSKDTKPQRVNLKDFL